jgi:hypothetical protein
MMSSRGKRRTTGKAGGRKRNVSFLGILITLATSATSAPLPALTEVRSAVEAVLAEQAVLWNTSFQVGFKHATVGSFGVAAGVADGVSGSRMSADMMIPMGSVTKAYTSAAVMKLVESGAVELDGPMHVYVDAALAPMTGGATLQDVWGGDATINTVTVRQLLHMRGGLHDYDDAALQAFTIDHPDEDKTPLDMLREVNKAWLCTPGTCGAYTSVGYVLLGFVQVGADPATPAWSDLDQRGFMTAAQSLEWNRTSFPLMGRCVDYDGRWNQTGGGARRGRRGGRDEVGVSIHGVCWRTASNHHTHLYAHTCARTYTPPMHTHTQLSSTSGAAVERRTCQQDGYVL